MKIKNKKKLNFNQILNKCFDFKDLYDEFYQKKFDEIMSQLKNKGYDKDEAYIFYACEVADRYAQGMLEIESEK